MGRRVAKMCLHLGKVGLHLKRQWLSFVRDVLSLVGLKLHVVIVEASIREAGVPSP